MHSFRGLTRTAAIGCTVSLLAGCGGGGSSPSPHGPAPTPTPTPAPNICATVQSTVRRASTIRRGVARAASSAVDPTRLYVTYRPSGTAPEAIDRLAGAVRGVTLPATREGSHRAITLAAGTDASAVAAALRANPAVVSVSPVHLRSTLQVASPNDPAFNDYDQWYLFKTDVTPDAWSHLPDGTGVSVAVIDTGADVTNVDLVSKIDYAESVIQGATTIGNAAVQDTNGHGTNVAGLAAAQANNAYGFAGVGYNAHLQIYKIFADATSTSDSQTASTADEAQAIADAVTHGASVINLSLGSPPDGGAGADPVEQDAVEAAITAGVTGGAAGGNDNGASPDYPGGYPGVIAVGASNTDDNNTCNYIGIVSEGVSSYSNSGVTMVAPGGDPPPPYTDSDVLHWVEGYSTTTAAYPPDRCTNSVFPPGSGEMVCRALFAGTSQATPQVAGTAALMMAYHGGARSLTPAIVLSILPANTDNIGQPTALQGAGRLNAGKAVAAAHP